jgi:cobyrinic acid a,c-diamide synthase
MEDLQNQIERSRLRWFGHVKRMDEHRIPKRLLGMKMSGRSTRDRPHTW